MSLRSVVLIVGVAIMAVGCGVKGDRGPTGDIGSHGSTGQPGKDGTSIVGPEGPAGVPGVNATGVVPVQLCPGFVPTYPSVFPESALCIGQRLYGVYSSLGGFLSLLTPGRYHSEGIGATCDFTVADNCVVHP